MSDHGTGFCQCKKCSVCQSLLVDLTTGRSYDQFGERSHFFAFQYSGCALKILQTAIGTGTNKHLINGSANKLADWMDVVHLRRAGKYWYEIFCIVVDGADIFSIRITNQ